MRLILNLFSAITFTAGAAFAGPVLDAAKAGDTALVAQLLEGGADANEPGVMTPLQMAALNGHADTAGVLIEHGAELDAVSTIMGTALHAAAQRGNENVIRVLLEAGADADAGNRDAFTPLMIASLNGRAAAVDALIEGGADPDVIAVSRTNGTGGQGRVNALHLAGFKGHWGVVDALRAAGAAPKPVARISDRLAEADPGLGRDLAAQRCGQCHKVLSESEVISGNNMGLSLVGVFGRRIGSRDDFEYSGALQRADGVWDEDLLYAFVTDAMLTIPGTRMNWHDGWTEDDVAHIVAYFRSAAQ